MHHRHNYYGAVAHHHFNHSFGNPNDPNSQAYAENLNAGQSTHAPSSTPHAAPQSTGHDLAPDHAIDLIGNTPQLFYGKPGTPQAGQPIGVVFADPATGRGYLMRGAPIMGQDGHTPVGVMSADPSGRMTPHYVSDQLRSLHPQAASRAAAPAPAG